MSLDWDKLWVPSESLLELVIRGTVMYFALFAAMRVLVRRHSGSLNLMDLLLVVLIADAAQNAMADEYRSITAGIVLCGTLIAWNYFLDFLAYRSKFVARLLEPAPLPLVKNGKMLRRHMRMELITEDELRSQLRQQEIDDLETVQLAYLEPDGNLSVRRSDERRPSPRQDKRSPPVA